MSEVQKPVEETVATQVVDTPATIPAVTEPATESAPVVEETPAAAAAKPTTTEEVPVTEEAVAEPVKEEATPIEEGILGYKGPGLLKSFIFTKKFFYFGSEAVETKTLSSYLRGEKLVDAANHNAAWAASTGKGLLFFTKKASEKATPAGLINLSDASEVTADGTVEFHFTVAGQKHTFQAASAADRENWVAQFNAKIAEAKESSASVKESESYKTALAALSPAVVAAAAAAKPEDKEIKTEEAADDKEVKKEEAAEVKEEKKTTRKDRSASRKRTSIFGSIPGFGSKKEEKIESPKEEVVVPAAEEVAPTTEVVEGAAPVVEETAVVATTEAPTADEVVVVAPVSDRPIPTKRNSIFGTLQSRFTSKKEKSTEAEAPIVPAKDEETVVSETAPVIPSLDAEAPAAVEEAAPVAEAPEVKTETPAVKSEKRKSTLPFLSKKEKSTPSDEEGEKPLSPFAKVRATLRGKKSEKSAEKASDKEKTVEEPISETKETEEVPAPAVVEPEVASPVVAAQAPTAQVSATA